MNLPRIIIIVITVAVGATFFYTLSLGSSDKEYISGVLAEREQKNDFMRSSQESPFFNDGTVDSTFQGLQYFEADIKYRVKAKLLPIENKKVVDLPTSTGETNRYLEYAWAEFELDGLVNRLLLLEVMTMGPARGTLFLAFADETSARETYGAGRYLELKKIPGGSIVLDFNKAYNPYCAYTDRYSCPLPPRENILKVAIRGGEKNYH